MIIGGGDMETRCSNCSFCWPDDGEQYPTCHFSPVAPWDLAPCEYDDREEEEEE